MSKGTLGICVATRNQIDHVIGLARAELEKMKTEGALEDRASSNALRKWRQ